MSDTVTANGVHYTGVTVAVVQKGQGDVALRLFYAFVLGDRLLTETHPCSPMNSRGGSCGLENHSAAAIGYTPGAEGVCVYTHKPTAAPADLLHDLPEDSPLSANDSPLSI